MKENNDISNALDLRKREKKAIVNARKMNEASHGRIEQKKKKTQYVSEKINKNKFTI